MKHILIAMSITLTACGLGDITGDYSVNATISEDTCAEPTRVGTTVQIGMTVAEAEGYYYLFEGSNGFILESEDGVDFEDSYVDTFLGCDQFYEYTASLVFTDEATGKATSMSGDLKLHYENCVATTCDMTWDLNGLRYIKTSN